MGRGRKPKPTSLKVLQGNPGKRRLNLEEPQYGVGAPDKPAWLDKFAAEQWDYLCAQLVEQRMLSKAESGILIAACTAYSSLRRNAKAIQDYGGSDTYIIKDKEGNKHSKTRPEAIRFEVARRQYVSFLAEMGLTQASRTKVKRLPETDRGGVKRLLG